LGGEELAQGRTRAARGGIDTGVMQDLPPGAGGDARAKSDQFARYPPVSPGGFSDDLCPSPMRHEPGHSGQPRPVGRRVVHPGTCRLSTVFSCPKTSSSASLLRSCRASTAIRSSRQRTNRYKIDSSIRRSSTTGQHTRSAGQDAAWRFRAPQDVRQPAIWGCAGEPTVPLSYGGVRLRAWHTGTTSTTFCRSDGPKRLICYVAWAPAVRKLDALRYRRRCTTVSLAAWFGHTPRIPVYRLDVITEKGYVLCTATFRAFSNASRRSGAARGRSWLSCRGGTFTHIERGLICAEWSLPRKSARCPNREVCLRHAFSAEDTYGIEGGTSESERAS
jgi:transcription factor WhiB